MLHSLSRILVLLGAIALCGCDGPKDPEIGPCDELVYSESGPGREAYLPCAGEIISVMDELKPLVEAAADGDEESRKEARRVYKNLRKLIRKAGARKLLDEWDDYRLNDLNRILWEAYTHYRSATMAPTVEKFQRAQQNHDHARFIYDGLT